MSLLKWKELAKSKSELGDKINTIWVKKQAKHLFQGVSTNNNKT